MLRVHRPRRPLWRLGLVPALLAGCAVGPNFKRPDAPPVDRYTEHPLPPATASAKVAGGQPQRFVEGLDIPGEWWKLFHSPALNALIERSLKANPDIKAAREALTAARENAAAQKGAYYPAVTGSFNGTRQKTSDRLSPVPNAEQFSFSLYTPEVAISYVPDVFGLNRRTVESLNAQAEQQRFVLVATHITLSSNVAVAAIQEASLRGQVDATKELIAINTRMLEVLRTQFAQGYASGLDVAAQQAQLAQVAATLPPLEKQLDQQRDLLAALSGGFASQGTIDSFQLASLHLPEQLPVSLPSRLVEQRPDVRQAQENLHASSALIGVAVANRLPNFNLTANVGEDALKFGQLFAPGAGFYALGGMVAQPIFDGGTLLHKERAARATYRQNVEQYRSTVVTAFQNVADSLVALEQDANALKAALAAEQAAKTSLDLTDKQMRLGYVSSLVLLNAEQTYQQALINLVQAQASRYADTVALFQALGGGWWHRTDLP